MPYNRITKDTLIAMAAKAGVEVVFEGKHAYVNGRGYRNYRAAYQYLYTKHYRASRKSTPSNRP